MTPREAVMDYARLTAANQGNGGLKVEGSSGGLRENEEQRANDGRPRATAQARNDWRIAQMVAVFRE